MHACVCAYNMCDTLHVRVCACVHACVCIHVYAYKQSKLAGSVSLRQIQLGPVLCAVKKWTRDDKYEVGSRLNTCLSPVA